MISKKIIWLLAAMFLTGNFLGCIGPIDLAKATGGTAVKEVTANFEKEENGTCNLILNWKAPEDTDLQRYGDLDKIHIKIIRDGKVVEGGESLDHDTTSFTDSQLKCGSQVTYEIQTFRNLTGNEEKLDSMTVSFEVKPPATDGTSGGTGGTGGTSGSGGTGGTVSGGDSSSGADDTTTGSGGAATSGTKTATGSSSKTAPLAVEETNNFSCGSQGWIDKIKAAGRFIMDPVGQSLQILFCYALEGLINFAEWVGGLLTKAAGLSYNFKENLAWLGNYYHAGGNFFKIERAQAAGFDASAFNETPLSVQLNQSLPGQHQDFLINAWKELRTFIDVFLIFVLIFIAFANIFRINIDTYTVKKSLPTLILGVILANASAFICRELIDVASILAVWLSGGNTGKLIEDVIHAIGIHNPTASNGILNLLTGIPNIGAGVSLIQFVISALILIIAIVGILYLAILLYIRIGIIYILFAVSPLAFLTMGFTLTSGVFKRWWGEMFKWTFLLPAVFFILRLASFFQAGPSDSSFSILRIAIVLGLTYAAAIVPMKMGGLGGAVMGFAAGRMVNPAARWAGKNAFEAGKGYAEKEFNKHGSVAPWLIPKAVRERSQKELEDARQKMGARVGSWRDKILKNRPSDEEDLVEDSQVAEAHKEIGKYSQERTDRAIDAMGQQTRGFTDRDYRRKIALYEENLMHNNGNTQFANVSKAFDDWEDPTKTAEEKEGAAKFLRARLNFAGFTDKGGMTDADLQYDYDQFRKECVDISGGIEGRNAKRNYIERMMGFRDPNVSAGEKKRRIKMLMLHQNRMNQLGMENNRWSFAHSTQINPTTGDYEWWAGDKAGAATDASGNPIEWDWKEAEAAASSERGKQDAQNDGGKTHAAEYTQQDKLEKYIHGKSTDQYLSDIEHSPELMIGSQIQRAERGNRKAMQVIYTPDATGKSSHQDVLERDRDRFLAGEVTERKFAQFVVDAVNDKVDGVKPNDVYLQNLINAKMIEVNPKGEIIKVSHVITDGVGTTIGKNLADGIATGKITII